MTDSILTVHIGTRYCGGPQWFLVWRTGGFIARETLYPISELNTQYWEIFVTMEMVGSRDVGQCRGWEHICRQRCREIRVGGGKRYGMMGTGGR